MKTGVLVAGGVAVVALGIADTAYRTRYWGATAREMVMPLPGDELVPKPTESVTRAVTVRAPADEVWRWVQEIGRVRGGVEVVPGRSMVLLGRLEEPGQGSAGGLRSGVVGGRGAAAFGAGGLGEGPLEAVTSLHVLPLDLPADRQAGPGRCRLVTRSRTVRSGAAARAASTVLEPVALILTRRLLLGVKDRAERGALTRAAAVSG